MPSSSIAAANKAIREVQVEAGAKRQCVELTLAQRFQIGKKGAEIGIAQAVRLYNTKYPNLKVSQPTARRAKHHRRMKACLRKKT